jgi:membrane fusion protein, multidrug efflux system
VARVEEGRLRFVEVEPGFNDGRVLQIRRGVAEGDVVALSPPSDLGEGAPVEPVEAPRKGSGAPAARSARGPPAR